MVGYLPPYFAGKFFFDRAAAGFIEHRLLMMKDNMKIPPAARRGGIGEMNGTGAHEARSSAYSAASAALRVALGRRAAEALASSGR